MKTLLKTLGVLSLVASPLLAGTTTPAPKNPKNPVAINDDLGISTDIGYDSNFVWRGLNYGRDWMRAGFRGVIPLIGGAGEDGAGSTALLWDVGYGTLLGDSDSFTPNLSTQPTTWPQDNKQSYQRLEAGLTLTHDFGAFAGSFGYRYIHNTGSLASGGLTNSINGLGFQGMHDIHELNTGLSTSLGPINLATSANYDMANGGFYFDATASSNIVVTDAISIVPHVNLGYGLNYKYGMSQGMRNYVSNNPGPSGVNGFTAVTVGIDFPIRLTRNATLTPYVAVNVPMNGLKNFSGRGAPPKFNLAAPYTLPNTPFQTIVYGGVTLSIKWGTNDNDTTPVLFNKDLGITADVGYDSNYVWRGINYGRNWARTALKGAIPLSESSAEDHAGETSILWDANYGTLVGDSDSFTPNMTTLGVTFPQHAKQSYQRMEVGANLAHDLGPVTASFGYRYIHNTGALSSGSLMTSLNGFGGQGIHDIHQLSTGLSASLGPINLASSANFDMANGGWYFDLNASTNFRVTDSISIVPSAGIGYGVNYNYGFSQGLRASLASLGASSSAQGVSGFTAATFAINFPIKLTRRTTFTPYIALNLPMSGLTNFGRNSAPVGGFPAFSQPRTPFNSVVYGGVSVSVSF
jgi:hypothetical protein